MVEQIRQALRYDFADPALLVQALTHSSAANELAGYETHNERLEFLGDAVLELCVSQELYNRFPLAREGQLTAMRSKMVNQEVLAGLARKIGLDTVLILGKGEEGQGGRVRASLLGDALEAVLGAVYVDGGFAAAQQVVLHLFAARWPAEQRVNKNKDPKSSLQEECQRLFKDRPMYVLESSEGPEHAKVFTVVLTLPDATQFIATGSSMKRAEQHAAQRALEALGAAGRAV